MTVKEEAMSTTTEIDSDVTYEWGVQEDGCEPEWTFPRLNRETGEITATTYTEESARKAARYGYHYDVKLIRRQPSGDVEVVPYEPAVLPPPDALPNLPDADTHGVQLCSLGEEGDCNVSLGHVDPGEMARAVTLTQRDLQGDEGINYSPDRVEHVHAIRLEAWGADAEEDDWELMWKRPDGTPITAETPGAFPLTIMDVQ